MSRRSARAACGALLTATLVVATGCTSTIQGTATGDAEGINFDGANIALMDTGPYRTTPSPPFGPAGSDVFAQHYLEGQRMAEFVTGPWECDADLVQRGGLFDLGKTGPMNDVPTMTRNSVLAQPVIDAAAKHNIVTGFSTLRLAPRAGGPGAAMLLQNAVMRFPDPAAAAAAAAEMAAASAPPPGAPPGQRVPVSGYPEAIATIYEVPRNGSVLAREVAEIFTPRGIYVLYQGAQSVREEFDFVRKSAKILAEGCLGNQAVRINRFVPTELSKLPELPKDPTGQLLAAALVAPDNAMAWIVGAWNPRGWLHFEDNPVISAALFQEAGVRTVASRRDTVYETQNPDTALRTVEKFTEELTKNPTIKPIDGVPGLTNARCFERAASEADADAALTWQRVEWMFGCVARADRFAYTTYSSSRSDVKQQTAAQYRMLSGK